MVGWTAPVSGWRSAPCFAFTSSTASWMMVRVRSPRKSILSMPASSTLFMSYCVTTSTSGAGPSRDAAPPPAARAAPFPRTPLPRDWTHTGT